MCAAWWFAPTVMYIRFLQDGRRVSASGSPRASLQEADVIRHWKSKNDDHAPFRWCACRLGHTEV